MNFYFRNSILFFLNDLIIWIFIAIKIKGQTLLNLSPHFTNSFNLYQNKEKPDKVLRINIIILMLGLFYLCVANDFLLSLW